MDVKQRILELMEKRGWSQYTPSRDSIVSICEAMGITLAEFYGGIEEHNLSEDQLRLLSMYEAVPANRRKLIFEFMEVLTKE